jgi:hypothetical protein
VSIITTTGFVGSVAFLQAFRDLVESNVSTAIFHAGDSTAIRPNSRGGREAAIIKTLIDMGAKWIYTPRVSAGDNGGSSLTRGGDNFGFGTNPSTGIVLVSGVSGIDAYRFSNGILGMAGRDDAAINNLLHDDGIQLTAASNIDLSGAWTGRFTLSTHAGSFPGGGTIIPHAKQLASGNNVTDGSIDLRTGTDGVTHHDVEVPAASRSGTWCLTLGSNPIRSSFPGFEFGARIIRGHAPFETGFGIECLVARAGQGPVEWADNYFTNNEDEAKINMLQELRALSDRLMFHIAMSGHGWDDTDKGDAFDATGNGLRLSGLSPTTAAGDLFSTLAIINDLRRVNNENSIFDEDQIFLSFFGRNVGFTDNPTQEAWMRTTEAYYKEFAADPASKTNTAKWLEGRIGFIDTAAILPDFDQTASYFEAAPPDPHQSEAGHNAEYAAAFDLVYNLPLGGSNARIGPRNRRLERFTRM